MTAVDEESQPAVNRVSTGTQPECARGALGLRTHALPLLTVWWPGARACPKH